MNIDGMQDAVVNIFSGAAASVSQFSQHVNPAVNAAVLAMFSDMPRLALETVHSGQDVSSQASLPHAALNLGGHGRG